MVDVMRAPQRPPFQITCPECHGRRQVERALHNPPALLVWPGLSRDTVVHRQTVACQRCLGVGTVDAVRVPVMQGGQRIGYLPSTFDPDNIRCERRWYTPRHGDFKRAGDTWVAAWSLGPGDFEEIHGFLDERYCRQSDDDGEIS